LATPQKPRRKDPTPKRSSNAFDQTRIHEESKDPNRVYVFASPRSVNMGVSMREALGWKVETRREDGPRLVIGQTSKEGEPILFMDCVLMSIDRPTWEDHERNGAMGGTGQAYFDEKDKIIRKRRTGIADSMPRSSAAAIQNKTDQVADLASWE